MDEYRTASATLKSLVESYERRVIEEALRGAGGNQRRAARVLGVLPTTLHEKMKRLGLLRRTDPLREEPVALAG
jgi:two-component system, NtrC family, response regulator HydG